MREAYERVYSVLLERVDHDGILERVRGLVSGEENVVSLETLYQNVEHMKIALREVESRMERVVNKLERYGIGDDGYLLGSLERCVNILEYEISASEKKIERFIEEEGV